MRLETATERMGFTLAALDALKWLCEENKTQAVTVEHLTDDAGVGWIGATVMVTRQGSALSRALKFIVSPTGRVWATNEWVAWANEPGEWERVEPPIRDASYDR